MSTLPMSREITAVKSFTLRSNGRLHLTAVLRPRMALVLGCIVFARVTGERHVVRQQPSENNKTLQARRPILGSPVTDSTDPSVLVSPRRATQRAC